MLLTDPKKQPNCRNNPLPSDELANIENKILEKKIAEKKKEELQAAFKDTVLPALLKNTEKVLASRYSYKRVPSTKKKTGAV